MESENLKVEKTSHGGKTPNKNQLYMYIHMHDTTETKEQWENRIDDNLTSKFDVMEFDGSIEGDQQHRLAV